MNKPIHPAFIMILFWGIILFVYFLGPINLTPGISLLSGVFLLTHIVLFVAGSVFAVILFNKKQHVISHREGSSLFDARPAIIDTLLLIGVMGCLFSIYNSIPKIGPATLLSIAKLRSLKAQSLLHGGEVHSGFLSIIAFLTYPAGFVGLVAGVLQYQRISQFTRILLYLFVGTIFGVAIFAGGRSPILLLVLFIGISCYTRTALNKPWMPRSKTLRLSVAIFLLAFIAYSCVIWTVRAAEIPGANTETNLQHAADVWGATPRPYLLQGSAWLNRPGLAYSVLGPVFYLTQSISVTEKILNAAVIPPALYGSYHIDVMAAVLRLFPEGTSWLKENYELLLNADIYGYFAGAWGALFLDYGYFSLLAAMLWGLLAGLSWVNLKREPCVLTAIFYVFWIYSIMISFVSPPFGFSNSFMVFVWFLVFYVVPKNHQHLCYCSDLP